MLSSCSLPHCTVYSYSPLFSEEKRQIWHLLSGIILHSSSFTLHVLKANKLKHIHQSAWIKYPLIPPNFLIASVIIATNTVAHLLSTDLCKVLLACFINIVCLIYELRYFLPLYRLLEIKFKQMNDLLKVMNLDISRGHKLFQNTPAMLFPSEHPASDTNGKNQMRRECSRAKKEILIFHKSKGQLNCDTGQFSRSLLLRF